MGSSSQPSIICLETLQANSILAWDWPLSAFDFLLAPGFGFAGSRETLGCTARPDATPLAKKEPGEADWCLLVHTVLPTPCTDLAQFM